MVLVKKKTDTFEKQIHHNRTRSAPATMRLFRIKSAKVYQGNAVVYKRPQSSIPCAISSREISSGPIV